ncbi:Putative secreted protein [Sphingopyxis fribergensis]|uniref:Putative secreted protein n=1 Tax=Sphingopyxis fribergensis TaxID=1515612 RepID=A0A0A7PGF9_9SPHN|nr:hypothetical protein [Sphingopyxis fribergensis]AJA09085.1 Putative secreted protein [Sphingopyxis fribergensis]
MKKLSMLCMAALISATAMSPAMAQHVAPAATSFTAASDPSDPIVFSKPGFGTSLCDYVLPGATGADLGGAHAGHAAGGTISAGYNTGPTATCISLTTDMSTFSMTGAGTGTIARVVVRSAAVPGQTLCDGALPFTIVAPGEISFSGTIPAGTVAGTCTVSGTLYTTPTISAAS